MIKQICTDRNIQHLIHFTDVRHLESILVHGLVPRNLLPQLPKQAFPNDPYRLDGHPDSVSLSISFPNDKMLYKYRRNTDKVYCILVLDASILWELDVAFCCLNAASAEISRRPIEQLKTAAAFSEMFQEQDGQRSREEQQLRDVDPTDVQAEVLVFDTICASYITQVVFTDDATASSFQRVLNGTQYKVHGYNKGGFGTRTFLLEY